MHKPITTALLSYGMSGEVFHAPLINFLNEFTLAKIVQRNSDSAKQRYPNVKISRSVDEIFADDEIELIVVNTPNETHYQFAAAALEAGKHVVVEKPFTVTVREADSLIELAKQQGVTLTVFQNRRWDGDFLTVQRVISNGDLGKLVEFEAHYDRFRNYIEENTWKEEKRPGTGILYNLGSHMLDQVFVLFGMPEWVDARVGIQRPGGRVEDFYDIRLEYPEHLAIVKSSYLVKAEMPRYIIHGTQGSFVKYGLDPQEQALKAGLDPIEERWGSEGEEYYGLLDVERGKSKIATFPGNYPEFYRKLYAAIRQQKEPPVKAEDARKVLGIIEACYQSARERRAIKLESR